ncbi:glutaminyl cyclase, putative [Leishmania tarentolae]|uniref:Glutaminyl cyclase, putative n=1 Tax=Leishmania tarentolae TaxID=5689 RepID=A0A640K965_LEITA|nr:glutaminyl cyclase, putative [Leishmania tarentolae]
MPRQHLGNRWQGRRLDYSDESPFWYRLLKRCLPCLVLRRGSVRATSRTHRILMGILLSLVATLIFLIGLLVSLTWKSNDSNTPSEAAAVRSTHAPRTPSGVGLQNPLTENSADLSVLQEREEALVRKWKENGFRPTYWELQRRTLPRLTKKALESWFQHGRGAAASTSAVDVPEDVLTAHAWDTVDGSDEDADLFDSLAFLYPPAQQSRYYRAAMNEILRHGPRVGGTKRDALLHHLVDEGLGRRRYNAARHAYHTAPPHLSPRGKDLLEKAAASWPDAPHLTATPQDEVGGRAPGWRWSLIWDNFTADIPMRIEGNSHVEMQNLVFQFPGGSQFRRKQATAASAAATGAKDPLDEFVGAVPNRRRTPADDRKEVLKAEYHPADMTGATVYTQETFLRSAQDDVPLIPRPALERGVPGTRVVLSSHAKGERVPLKPSLSAQAAEPASQQPIKHAVLAAHWDSKYFADLSFLGACDSAMPLVFLLRTIKNIAVLTDVAEALTESYKAERSGAVGSDVSDVIPGLTSTFRNATTEAEVRQRLSTLLSPAHHALLYQYFFARPYSVGGAPENVTAEGTQNHPTKVEVDVRAWLDWVQHLPILSVILFDGEEAYKKWSGEDNTYGSRRLAQRWRSTPSVMRTRYSDGPQSLYDSVDLFSLYDLMGPAGTTFSNMYPTQSGIFYAGLSQRERELRHRAMKYSSAISAELLWRYHEAIALPQASERVKADPFLRVLGPSPHEAVAAINAAYTRQLLANNDSRPSAMSLPLSWLMYGAPHEMFTLHSVARTSHSIRFVENFDQLRVYDKLNREIAAKSNFDAEDYLNNVNHNIFFSPSQEKDLRRSRDVFLADDDHKHWLDTQRVLHLIPVPFPKSWHTVNDNGSNVHDGTSTDLAGLLWSTVLELGDYWTRKE